MDPIPTVTGQSRPRVLIVDDDEIITRRVGELFVLSGYDVGRAHSGSECLTTLESEGDFDAVILDIDLGERAPHGGEIATAIRDRYGVPVVFYTGHTDHKTIALTRKTEPFGLVAKAPNDQNILIASVEAAITRGRNERETTRLFVSYREILRWMPVPLCVFDRTSGSSVLANDAAARLFGELSLAEQEDLFDADDFPEEVEGVVDGKGPCMQEWTVGGPLVDRTYRCHWLVATRDLGNDQTIRAYYDVTRVCERARRIEHEAEHAQALLRDVHHRVKNNLAVVDALLDMTQRRLEDPEVLDTVRMQVNAVRTLHERLHATQEHKSLDLTAYLDDIARSSIRNDGTVRIVTTWSPRSCVVSSRICLPLGIIVAELITNAQKHSLVDGADDWIRVTLRDVDTGLYELAVEYGGVPLPPDEVLDRADGSGIALIRGLVRQLDAELTIERKPHNAFRIYFRPR